MFEKPILITGCPRSGTSLVAGVLRLCGVFSGKVDKMNENIRIREKIIKPFMVTQYWDKEGAVLPDIGRVNNIELIGRPRIRGVLNVEGYNGTGQWMYKDCRIAVLYPVWQKMFPGAVFVVVRRRVDDIVASCYKTGWMQSYETEQGWRNMAAGYIDRFEQMEKSGLKVVNIQPDLMIDGNYEQIKNLVINHTGCNFDEDKIKQYIEPRLWRKEAQCGQI